MRSNLSFQSMQSDGDDELWLVRSGTSAENIVVSLSGPLVLFRVRVMELEGVKNKEGLFGELLTLNANDLIHGSYGIEGDHVVLTAGLPIENLDYNEFQVTVDDLSLALTNHYENLTTYREATA